MIKYYQDVKESKIQRQLKSEWKSDRQKIVKNKEKASCQHMPLESQMCIT